MYYECIKFCGQKVKVQGHSTLVTELLQLPVPGYGTVYRHISEMLT